MSHILYLESTQWILNDKRINYKRFIKELWKKRASRYKAGIWNIFFNHLCIYNSRTKICRTYVDMTAFIYFSVQIRHLKHAHIYEYVDISTPKYKIIVLVYIILNKIYILFFPIFSFLFNQNADNKNFKFLSPSEKIWIWLLNYLGSNFLTNS